MKGSSILLILLICLLVIPGVSLGERSVKHYQAVTPETAEEAKSLIREQSKVIENILMSDTAGSVELEEVHKITYSMEAALKKLKPQPLSESFTDVADTLERLHLQSEKHNLEGSRSASKALSKKLDVFLK